MKHLIIALYAALLQASVFGALQWSGGDYMPETWTPNPGNVLFGVKHYNDVSELTKWNGDPKVKLKNDSFVLNNGTVPKESLEITEIAQISPDEIFALNGGQAKWNFPEAVYLSEVKIFSRWADGGRDGMYIKQVRVKKEGSNDWVCIAGDDSVTGVARGDIGREEDGSPGDKNDSSGALWIALSNPGGYLVEEKVHALNIVFSGSQDNSGTGYVEIEANVPVESFVDPSGKFKINTLGVSGFEDGEFTLSRPAEIEILQPVSIITSAGYFSVHNAGEKVFIAVSPDKPVSVSVIGPTPPPVVVAATGIADVNCVGGMVFGNVLYLSDDLDNADLFLKYGRTPDSLNKSLHLYSVCDSGEFQAPAENAFAPFTTYYAQVVAKSDSFDTEILCGDVFEFKTLPENSGRGLWQRKLDNKGNYAGDVGFHEDVFAVREGKEEWDRYIENGAVMAYQDGEYESTFSGITSGWYNEHRTFIYQGYMYLKAGSYKFVSNIDDYAYFAVEGADIHYVNAWTKNATSTWTCEKSGWYKVAIAVGDHTGIRGPMEGVSVDNAFYYEVDGDGIKRKFLDEGDGEPLFLATLAPGLTLSSASRSGQDFVGSLAFGSALKGAQLLRVSGDAYGGTDTNAWREVVAVDSVGEESSRVENAQNLPEDTAYIRYVAVLPSGSLVWSNTLLWDDIEVVNREKPRAVLGDIVPHAGGAAVNVELMSTGVEDKAAVTVVAYPVGNESVISETTFENLEVGGHSLVVGGLKPNRNYKLKIKVRSGDVEGDESSIVDFATTLPREGVFMLPGLWQVRDKRAGNPGGWTPDTDVMSVPVGDGIDDRQLVSGVIMAYGRNEDVTDPISNKTYTWKDQDYLSFLYEGYMYFSAGAYGFISSIDDTAYLAIDGEPVHVCSSYVDGAKSSWNCPADGWYKVKMLIGDITGDGGYIKLDSAFHYSLDGGEYKRFIDGGDGNLLRVPGGDVNTKYWFEKGRLYIDLEVENLPQGSQIFLLSGKSDEGILVDSWDSCVELNEQDYKVIDGRISVGPLDVSSVSYAKLYLDMPVGYAFSSLISMTPSQVSLSPVVEGDFSRGIAASFRGSVVSSGGADTVSVKIQISTSPDFSNPAEYEVGNLSSGVVFERTVEGLSLETTYYYRAIASSSDGSLRDETIISSCTTPGAPEFGALSASGANWNGEFSASVIDPGPGGEARLVLLVGEDENSLAELKSVSVKESGNYDFGYEFDFTNKKLYYAFVLENSTPAGVFSVTSAVETVDLVCTYNYYWRPDVLEGAWENPENWVNQDGNPLDPRCAYPNSKKSQVRFDRASDEPVTITVNGVYDIYGFRSEKAKDITLVGLGKDSEGEYTSKITADKSSNNDTTYFVEGMKFILDGIEYSTKGTYAPPAKSLLELRNAAKMSIGDEGIRNIGDGAQIVLKGGSVLDVHNQLEHATSAKWSLVIEDSTLLCDKRVQFSKQNNGGQATVEFKGAEPVFSVDNISVAWDSGAALPANLIFHIPVDGYERAPIGPNGNPERALIDWGNNFLSFSVADDSPVFKTDKTLDVKLCEWTDKGIYINQVRSDVSQNREDKAARLTFYFTDTQGNKFYPVTDENGVIFVKDESGNVFPVNKDPNDSSKPFISGRKDDGRSIVAFWVQVSRAPGFEIRVCKL